MLTFKCKEKNDRISDLGNVNTWYALSQGAASTTRVHTRPWCRNIQGLHIDCVNLTFVYVFFSRIYCFSQPRGQLSVYTKATKLSIPNIATSTPYSAIVRCFKNCVLCTSYWHLYANEYMVDFKKHWRGLRFSTLLCLAVVQLEKCHP